MEMEERRMEKSVNGRRARMSSINQFYEFLISAHKSYTTFQINVMCDTHGWEWRLELSLEDGKERE